MKLLFLYSSLFLILNTQVSGQILDTSISFSNVLEDSIFNYVRNPSFEEFSVCPNNVDQLNKCNYWQKVPDLHDSPDYFHRCATYSGLHVGVPNNSHGNQEPNFGNAYTGLIMFGKGFYHEYIQNQLYKPLSNGTEYIVGMYVSLANKSKFATDRVTFCFSDKPKLAKKSRMYKGRIDEYLSCQTGVLVKNNNLITDTIKWVLVEGEYIARGGEKYLTIGVFDGDIKWWNRFKMRRKIINKNWSKYNIKVPYAYYYIDDVYVIRKEDYLKMKQYDEIE